MAGWTEGQIDAWLYVCMYYGGLRVLSGSRRSSTSLLAALDEIQATEQQLSDALCELADINRELESVKARGVQYNEMRKGLHAKQQELDVLESKLKQTKHHQMMETVNTLHQTIGGL